MPEVLCPEGSELAGVANAGHLPLKQDYDCQSGPDLVGPTGGTRRSPPRIHPGVFLFNVTMDDLESGAYIDDLSGGDDFGDRPIEVAAGLVEGGNDLPETELPG